MCIFINYKHVYVKYIKIYVCEIYMPFTCIPGFQESALVQQNSINEHKTNLKKSIMVFQ